MITGERTSDSLQTYQAVKIKDFRVFHNVLYLSVMWCYTISPPLPFSIPACNICSGCFQMLRKIELCGHFQHFSLVFSAASGSLYTHKEPDYVLKGYKIQRKVATPWNPYLVKSSLPHKQIFLNDEQLSFRNIGVYPSNFYSNKGLVWKRHQAHYVKSSPNFLVTIKEHSFTS